uniref:(northern house mosquito) hypothetical protein n=1 Tax=Culex pipiens TaxID=7175 RepID=A0A8D8BLH1_CULPI
MLRNLPLGDRDGNGRGLTGHLAQHEEVKSLRETADTGSDLGADHVLGVRDRAVNTRDGDVRNLAEQVKLLAQVFAHHVGLGSGIQQGTGEVFFTVAVQNSEHHRRQQHAGAARLRSGVYGSGVHCGGGYDGVRVLQSGAGMDHRVVALVAVLAVVLRATVPGKVVASEAVTAEPLVRDHPHALRNVHAVERSAVHDRVLLFVAGGAQRDGLGRGFYCGVRVDAGLERLLGRGIVASGLRRDLLRAVDLDRLPNACAPLQELDHRAES